MVKHTQTTSRLLPTNCLRVFDHFVVLALKGLYTSVFGKLGVQNNFSQCNTRREICFNEVAGITKKEP